jgi:UPF0755 protein
MNDLPHRGILQRVRSIRSRTILTAFFALAFVTTGSALVYEIVHAQFRQPAPLPESILVTIPEGSTLTDAVALLEERDIVSSALMVQWIILLRNGEQQIKAGDYYFEDSVTAGEAARRLLAGEYGLTPVVVTIPEGVTTYQMADILEKRLERFDAITFLERTKHMEGYLFPDTYYFLPNVTLEEVVDTMETTLYEKIDDLMPLIEASEFTLHEILTIASMLEREANTFESKRMIAGIINTRLALEMPLQIDAVFGYIYGRETFHPRYSHLEVDSPYNTYRVVGLPPGPIASPGYESIKAALNPIDSPYIFYLTGRDGNMYYSETYAQHTYYKAMYLD